MTDHPITQLATIARMQQEIMSDVMDGKVPIDVGNFSELHDYVDANEYGGFCEQEFSDALDALFGGRNAEGDTLQESTDFVNHCQYAIGFWLCAGGLGRAFAGDEREAGIKAIAPYVRRIKKLEHIIDEIHYKSRRQA